MFVKGVLNHLEQLAIYQNMLNHVKKHKNIIKYYKVLQSITKSISYLLNFGIIFGFYYHFFYRFFLLILLLLLSLFIISFEKYTCGLEV